MRWLAVLFVVAVLAVYAARYRDQRFNVVLVSLDTVRADSVAAYNPAAEPTPALDRLASEGFLFERSFANASWTLPSHMSLFTGLFPQVHGVGVANYVPETPLMGRREALARMIKPLDPGMLTLPEYLREHGYHTAWFSQSRDPHMDLSMGFHRGFEDIQPWGLDTQRGAEKIKDWLETNRAKNFFLFLHSKVAHAPYNAISAAPHFSPGKPPADRIGAMEFSHLLDRALYGREPKFHPHTYGFITALYEIGICHVSRRHVAALAKIRLIEEIGSYLECQGLGKVGNLSRLRKFYEINVRYADALLGEVVDKLRELGLYDRTIVVVTSDHGESFLEHGLMLHNHHYDEVMRVPLLLRVPGLVPRRLAYPAQGADILPTLLDLLGIRARSGLQGESLRRAWEGKENLERPLIAADLMQGWRMIRKGNWKLVVHRDSSPELFNLEKDPNERFCLAEQEPEVVNRLRLELDELETNVKE